MKHSKFFLICFVACMASNYQCEDNDDCLPMPEVFGIYNETSEHGVKLDVDSYLGIDYGGAGNFVPNLDSGFVDDLDEKKEGLISKRSTINVGYFGDWAIWFVANGLANSPDSETKNMCDYKGGKLKLWVKCQPEAKDLLVGIRSGNVSAGEETSKVVLSDYPSFAVDNQWHEVSIPFSDFEGDAPRADLTQIKVFFVIGSSSGETGGTNGNATFWVDNVRWVK